MHVAVDPVYIPVGPERGAGRQGIVQTQSVFTLNQGKNLRMSGRKPRLSNSYSEAIRKTFRYSISNKEA